LSWHGLAKIIFCDIDVKTRNIDPSLVEKLITEKTKAITVVDYAGHPVDLEVFRKICDKHGIYLIEDAAHSIGSLYKGKPVGSQADLTVFSFFPTKNLTTAEGGAVSSIHPELLQKARKFSRQGLIREKADFVIKSEGVWHQEVHDFGLNYRLPDVLCALGVSQLSRISEFKKDRTELFNYYTQELGNISAVRIPIKHTNVDPMWHLYPIHVDPSRRNEIFNFLRLRGVGVQVNYIPAHWHPVFKKQGFEQGMFPVSNEFYSGEISIPMFVGLTHIERQSIILAINDSLANFG
jgi:dTDP-4-amino-4,6-dideoxygalactose transaminase